MRVLSIRIIADVKHTVTVSRPLIISYRRRKLQRSLKSTSNTPPISRVVGSSKCYALLSINIQLNHWKIKGSSDRVPIAVYARTNTNKHRRSINGVKIDCSYFCTRRAKISFMFQKFSQRFYFENLLHLQSLMHRIDFTQHSSTKICQFKKKEEDDTLFFFDLKERN